MSERAGTWASGQVSGPKIEWRTRMVPAQTPESITAQLHRLAREHGTTFAQEYANYHPEQAS